MLSEHPQQLWSWHPNSHKTSLLKSGAKKYNSSLASCLDSWSLKKCYTDSELFVMTDLDTHTQYKYISTEEIWQSIHAYLKIITLRTRIMCDKWRLIITQGTRIMNDRWRLKYFQRIYFMTQLNKYVRSSSSGYMSTTC